MSRVGTWTVATVTEPVDPAPYPYPNYLNHPRTSQPRATLLETGAIQLPQAPFGRYCTQMRA
jgi:hypothetical protein